MLEIKTVTNGPITEYVQRACHDTLSWLISFSLIWLWICQWQEFSWGEVWIAVIRMVGRGFEAAEVSRGELVFPAVG